MNSIINALRSQSPKSSQIGSTEDRSLLTSTKLESTDTLTIEERLPRKALKPEKPKTESTDVERFANQKENDTQSESSDIDDQSEGHSQSENDQSDKPNHKTNNETNDKKDDEKESTKNDIKNKKRKEDEKNDKTFDQFILTNFLPFTGQESVLRWLQDTETKFNIYRIGRDLRYAAISLLVEGEARYRYMKHRRTISSFDDFYEFLLSQYDLDNYSPKLDKIVNNKSLTVSTFCQTDSFNKVHFCNNPNTTDQSTICPPYIPVTHDATTNTGETSAIKSANFSHSSVLSEADQTLNALRKAIVDNLIKNPKTFKGGKDDVKKWIEEIEHLFDLAHIPESTRLDLVSYSLRGDALEWFKNNRSSFSSWSVFLVELKRAFISSFHEEIAFKKLEAYSQGQNQSVRSFFNEVIKLCKETDPTMSEATKLKNLLNKTKPTIQYEVRKKKPTSTSDFLEYAREAEELMQLSSMTIDESDRFPNAQMSPPSAMPSWPSKPPPLMDQSYSNPSYKYSSAYPRPFDRNYGSFRTQNPYSDAPFTPSPYTNPNANNPRPANTSSQSYRPGFPKDSGARGGKNNQPPRNNKPDNKYSQPRTANTIDSPYPPVDDETLPEPFLSVVCDRCNQLGHDASSCSSF